jgi:hypothetical protein
VAAILKRRYPRVRVQSLRPTGKKPNLSRLAQQIERLIQQALVNREASDCIAVLHDLDQFTRPNLKDRADYDHIKAVCSRYRKDVVLVVAWDEIEAWLLADPGLCAWLGIKPSNWDEARKPSEDIANFLDKAGKPKYREGNLSRILAQLDGTGDQFSPSLKAALAHLDDAPCTHP